MTYYCSKKREEIAKKSGAGAGAGGVPKWAMAWLGDTWLPVLEGSRKR